MKTITKNAQTPFGAWHFNNDATLWLVRYVIIKMPCCDFNDLEEGIQNWRPVRDESMWFRIVDRPGLFNV